MEYALYANAARRKYSSCDELNVTVLYTTRTEDIVVGTFLMKNSTGSNRNRIWCEFMPASDPDLMAHPGYIAVKNRSAFDRRTHSVFHSLQFDVKGID